MKNKKYLVSTFLSGLFSLAAFYTLISSIGQAKGGYSISEFVFSQIFSGSFLIAVVLHIVILVVLLTDFMISLSFYRNYIQDGTLSRASVIVLNITLVITALVILSEMIIIFFIPYGILLVTLIAPLVLVCDLIIGITSICLAAAYFRSKKSMPPDENARRSIKKITRSVTIITLVFIVVGVSLMSYTKLQPHTHPYSDQSGLTYAIENKDPANCRKYYGNNTAGYYCEYLYMQNVPEFYPKDINLCRSMNSGPDDLFYKDNCFRGIAELNLDPVLCSNLSVDQTECKDMIEEIKFRKTYLCGALFDGKQVPDFGECSDYVFSLHDISKCNLLTPEWNKNACIASVNTYKLNKK